jgi:hypothetical protein
MQMQKTVLYACIFFLSHQWSMGQSRGSTQDAVQTVPEAEVGVSRQHEFKPMTQAGRLHHYLQSTFGLEGILRSAAGSGISQLQNTPSEWGQGAEGYSKRLENSYGQHIIRATLMYGASNILHEDNRYIPCDASAVGARLKYAIASSFLARKDDGTRRLSLSRLGSYLATAFISREWQPHSTSGAQNAMMSFETVMGTTVGFNVAREFLPKVFHRHRD